MCTNYEFIKAMYIQSLYVQTNLAIILFVHITKRTFVNILKYYLINIIF